MDHIHPVVLKRHTAIVLLRTVALIAILVGVFSVLYPIGRAWQMGGGMQSIRIIFDWPAWFGVGLATFIPGFCLMVLDRRIARWLVPMPCPICPECGYDLRKQNTRCPECGLDLAVLNQP
jgi:hypothetical protein